MKNFKFKISNANFLYDPYNLTAVTRLVYCDELFHQPDVLKKFVRSKFNVIFITKLRTFPSYW
jgi:hypothetical protein